MHSHTDGEMAIPRVFNSNTPFIIVSGGSELTFLSKEENNQGCEEEKESLVQAITPHLGRVMQHGTAKHMVTQGREESEENPCVSIVAQAEREDFQEFSPTITQGPFSRSQQLKKLRSVSKESAFISDTEDEDFDVSTKRSHYHWQRKQRRKARTRQSPEEGGEPPVICGLWVQEIDWLKSADAENVAAASSAELIPPPPQFTDSVLCSCCHRDTHSSTCDEGCSCAELGDFVRESEDVSPSEDLCRSIMSDETSSSEDRTGSDFDCGLDQTSESICTHDGDSDSSCCAEDDTQTPERLGVEANVSDSNFDLMHVSGFNLSHVDWDYNSDDPSDTGEVLNAVGGRVTKMPKLCASPLLEDLIKDTLEDWTHNMAHNEGLIFHHQLQPRGCQYREGEEYSILHHIQNGSYGDVFCVQDKRTGFKCAAKRVSQ
ncbi:uncharacterized protein LOC103381633 isoform X2 [Cynoglossus semilaevis]|nr:uncharacterized protein LOC103381633 isoform X2 [Cynoglossus semilaevis]